MAESLLIKGGVRAPATPELASILRLFYLPDSPVGCLSFYS
jgi:hypothetical protein